MQNYYEEGAQHLKNDDLNSAISSFGKALELNPYDINSIIGMAQAYFFMLDYDTALDYLKNAIDLIPDNNQVQEFYMQVKQLVESSKKTGRIANNKLLTLCMIVKNEEENLHKCLDSVKDIVDEIVICDTGSTDSTIEIAKSYNAILTSFVWVDDYAAARNQALQYCTGEWILYLDADEILSKESAINLRDFLKNASEKHGGFICDVWSKHYNDNDILEDYVGKYSRIFRNLGFPKIKFFGKIHEQITPSIIENGYQILSSDIKIIHNGYAIPRSEMETKVRRNLNILLNHVNSEPTNGYAWYQLGNTLAQMKIYDQAKNSLINSIKCGNLSTFLICNTALQLADIASKEKNYRETIRWADSALEVMPHYIPAMHLKAQAHLIMGNALEAKMIFEKILDNPNSSNIVGFDYESIKHYIETGLNNAKKMLGER